MASNKKYKLNYNFGKNNTAVQDFLTRLSLNSQNLFNRQLQNGQILDWRNEHASMLEFIRNIEEYLHYCQHDPNFNFIFNSISILQGISVLPPNMRGVYGCTENSTIYMNPNLSENGILNSQERTKLYVAHELGHLINRGWLQYAQAHLNSQYKSRHINLQSAQLSLEGFSLLDEVTTQNRAEEFAYFSAHKMRPPFRTVYHPNIFNGHPYVTNFDYYGELQTPALSFARTLRGIGSINNDSNALKRLSDRALNSNFAQNIINEYYVDGQLHNLYPLLQYMGTIKDASYALFGMGDPSSLAASKSVLDKFNNLAASLRDVRCPNNQK